MKRPDSGRVMAYALLAGGTLATVASNYAHAEDHFGAQALSAVIPVLLFGAFHVAAYDGRWLIRGGTGVVALVCFGISFDHIRSLALRYGESDASAVLYPLGIDGAMIVATFVLSRSRTVEDKPLSPAKTRPLTTPRSAIDNWGQRTAVAHALSSDPKPAVLSSPVEDKAKTPVLRSEDNEARLSAAQKIADDLGDSLSRARLIEGLKAQGFKISTGAAADLTRELKAGRS